VQSLPTHVRPHRTHVRSQRTHSNNITRCFRAKTLTKNYFECVRCERTCVRCGRTCVGCQRTLSQRCFKKFSYREFSVRPPSEGRSWSWYVAYMVYKFSHLCDDLMISNASCSEICRRPPSPSLVRLDMISRCDLSGRAYVFELIPMTLGFLN
jgi:hypothetical protein